MKITLKLYPTSIIATQQIKKQSFSIVVNAETPLFD